MTPARSVLVVLGFIFLAAGAYVAATIDSLTGLAVLVVGAVLLVLPFSAVHED